MGRAILVWYHTCDLQLNEYAARFRFWNQPKLHSTQCSYHYLSSIKSFHDWSKHVKLPNIPQLKLGNIREYSPILKIVRVAKKIWRIIKTVVSIWGGKQARIFVLGHYLFGEANSFPRAKLEENCELRGTDNVQGQISEHIFAPNWGYCLYYPSNLFRNTRSFENWGIFSDIPQF